jgi:hypothetical protein
MLAGKSCDSDRLDPRVPLARKEVVDLGTLGWRCEQCAPMLWRAKNNRLVVGVSQTETGDPTTRVELRRLPAGPIGYA